MGILRLIVVLIIFFTHNLMIYSQEHRADLSLESYNYNQKHLNQAIIKNQPYAILIVAFNRPDYLAQVIASLEQNPESQRLPFYFFLDGGPHAKQKENVALINASTIKNKTIILRDRNYGCPKNHIDAKRFMFDWCGFKKVIILEEDLVVSASFIHLNLELHKWARKRFSNVGVVQCWSYCYLPEEEKSKRLHWVEDSANRWWSFVGYCLDQQVWNDIRSTLYAYEFFIDQIPHTDEFSRQRSKPGTSFVAEKIRAWARKLMTQRNSMQRAAGKSLFKTNVDSYIDIRFASLFEPNQDVMMGFALWMAGYTKIRTVVNRARHVGEVGISTDKDIFHEAFQAIKLDNFTKKDLKLYNFIVKS